MEKYKLSTFMIDNILNEYYVGTDLEYIGYKANITEDDVNYVIYFKTFYRGKEATLCIKVTKGGFAKIISDALIKLKGFNNPYVKITVRENTIGYQVEYQENYSRNRKKR